jgi:hypothetical protein
VKTDLALSKLDIQSSGYSSVARVDWDLNGDGLFDDATSLPPFTVQASSFYGGSHYFTPIGTWVKWDTPGVKMVGVKVTYTNASTETSTGTVEVVEDAISTDVVRSSAEGGDALAATSPLLTGQITYFRANASVTSGVVSSYAWDLNGDGVFDDATGATVSASYATSGSRAVKVRVVSRGGQSATGSVDFEVRLAPPAGEPGFTINDVRPYTNDPNVKLSIVWPAYATQVRFSNDGAFRASTTVVKNLIPDYEWKLDDSVKALYTKVVYMRFSGSGIDDTRTYTDDIILDLTPPTVTSFTAQAAAGSKSRALMFARSMQGSVRGTSRVVRIRALAKDRESSVVAMQITDSKLKPGLLRGYAQATRLLTKKAVVYFRAQDAAGNWSAWQSAKVKPARRAGK